jgi:hypothetical protein
MSLSRFMSFSCAYHGAKLCTEPGKTGRRPTACSRSLRRRGAAAFRKARYRMNRCRSSCAAITLGGSGIFLRWCRCGLLARSFAVFLSTLPILSISWLRLQSGRIVCLFRWFCRFAFGLRCFAREQILQPTARALPWSQSLALFCVCVRPMTNEAMSTYLEHIYNVDVKI